MGTKPQDVSPASVSGTSPADTPEVTVTPSEAVAQAQVPDVAPDVQETTPPSSVGDQGEPESKETLLSVVRKAVETEPEGEGGTPPGPEKQEEKDAADQADEGADDPSKPPPFHNHPRWKQVIEERNRYRDDATEYRKITSFLEENRLEATEAANALQAAAVVKAAFEGRADPRQALEFIDQWRGRLAQMAGIELPEDLRERVEGGYVDERTASELAASRARNTVRQEMAEQERAREAARVNARQVADTQASLGQAASEWETAQQASDPDYSRKQKAVERYARALVAERGVPSSQAEVKALLDAALAEVNQTFVSPRPRATAPQPRSFSSTTAGTAPAPKSLAEAIALAAGRGA